MIISDEKWWGFWDDLMVNKFEDVIKIHTFDAERFHDVVDPMLHLLQ